MQTHLSVYQLNYTTYREHSSFRRKFTLNNVSTVHQIHICKCLSQSMFTFSSFHSHLRTSQKMHFQMSTVRKIFTAMHTLVALRLTMVHSHMAHELVHASRTLPAKLTVVSKLFHVDGPDVYIQIGRLGKCASALRASQLGSVQWKAPSKCL